ncbi:MAG: hypothetical protein ACP5JY_01405 [Candidatus Nanoarchaeia archaeon]
MKMKKFMKKFYFSKKEIIHLVFAALAISFAFEFVLFNKQIFSPNFSLALLIKLFLEAFLIIAFAFILHELGHKFVAQYFGVWAEFRAWPFGLILAIALALVSRGGFVFAAPGAVVILPVRKTSRGYLFKKLSKKQIGYIGIVGVLINIILASTFLLLAHILGLAFAALAAQINAWLAIFNLIPLSVLDGAKVWYWSKGAWTAVMITAISLFVLILLL